MPPSYFEFTDITPANTLEEVWKNFDPTLVLDPESEQYVPRTERGLQKLAFKLKHATNPVHAFLCGHRGSGKTTELNRLCMDDAIQAKFFPLYLTAREFGSEGTHLTHDAVMVGIGRELAKRKVVDSKYAEEIDQWGLQIVETFLKNEDAKAEAGAKANAWFAFFKAQLSTRREWKYEQKQILAPKVQDLIAILNRMAQDLKNRTGKQLLVVVDDLEKGDSDAHKEMHGRLFQENYDTLVQPNFSLVYTLPIYFRAMAGRRIPPDELYAFSAVRLYDKKYRTLARPPLDDQSEGYKLMRAFVDKRITNTAQIFPQDELLDELLRIGGGLFRETARAIMEAAYLAIMRGADHIEEQDVTQVFDQVKKEYQPMIRGDAIKVFDKVDKTGRWEDGVEPFLQSRAVVEYENGDLWIDLRYILKTYIRSISEQRESGINRGD